jgi:hypothetical protein
VRSILLSSAIHKEAEVAVLVDADTIPLDDAIERITEQATPTRAVFGIYRLRDGNRLSVEVDKPEEALLAISKGQHFPIKWGGLGLCAIHRESLRAVWDTLPTVTEGSNIWRPFCQPFARDGQWYGDDRSLCDRLICAGTQLMADPTLSVQHAVTSLLSGVS